ncbi:MAG: hypothetical protein C0506_01395 [Anaerolinea sp.]|nr:hypothetical protein [Anaerolinea sp.]
MKPLFLFPLAALLLAGCSAASGATDDATTHPDATPEATATAAPASTPEAGRTPPVASPRTPAANPARDDAKAGGPNRAVDRAATTTATATLEQVNVRSVNGRDAVSFDFGGAIPGYRVEYASAPAQCGSGKPLPLPTGAAAAIVVRFSPAQAHDAAGKLTIPNTVVESTGKEILAATQICDFEGVVSWAIPVTARGPFAVIETNGRVAIIPGAN